MLLASHIDHGIKLGLSATSRGVVEFLNTVRVSCLSLGRQFWKDHRLVDDLGRVVHGGQLKH